MNDAEVAFDFAAPQQAQPFATGDATAAAAPTSSGPTDLYGGDQTAVAAAAGDDAAAAEAAAAAVPAAAHKGRMAEPEAQIFSDTIRRLSRSRGGVFEMLSLLPGQVAGEPAQSLEGWVLIITGLPAECTEGDILDYFGRRAEVKNSRMNFDRRTSQCIGHAFVEYQTREEAELVVADMNGQPFLTSSAIAVAPAFVVPELSAFEQLGRTAKRGRDGDRVRGADEAEAAVEGDAAVEDDTAETAAVRGVRPDQQ